VSHARPFFLFLLAAKQIKMPKPKTTYTVKIHLGIDLLIEAASVKEAASIAKEVAFRKGLVISVERDEDIAAG